jgi:predicted nucleic acid-binding protein
LIVVDTNLIAYLLIQGERTETAERVLDADEDWNAPLIWRSELRNTLAKSVWRNRIEMGEAFRIMTEAESIMAEGEFPVVSGDVLSLAGSSGCSAYDAEFVVLARDLRVPLVTTDKELLEKFPETAVSPERFLARQT